MMYELFGTDAEIRGTVIQACLESSQGERLFPFLDQHGLSNPNPQAWYPMSQWLEFINDVYSAGAEAASAYCVAIGIREAEMAYLPDGMTQFPQFLLRANELYHLSSRGSDAGLIQVECLGEKHVRLHCCVPHPDGYLYGIFYGLLRRRLQNRTFSVTFDRHSQRRDHGGETTILHIKWE